MDITIYPNKLQGTVAAIPSKSQAHRLLLCSAFSDRKTELFCPETNDDIEATVGCLRSLGAAIERTETGYIITPVGSVPQQATMDCRESGSTLRFILPVVGALGIDTTLHLAGRLPQRPLSPLWEEMERMGCTLSRPTEDTIRCTGKLKPGNYCINGSVSSQFITGLLFAMALLPGSSTLSVTGKLESKPYIDMTLKALRAFGVIMDGFQVSGCVPFHSPGNIAVEGDWSNGAFFLAAKSLGCDLTVTGLDPNSPQGDRAVVTILEALQSFGTIDAADIPDLVPVLAVVAGAKQGACFTNIGRLRLKESDRVASVAAMLKNLGIETEISENELLVKPGNYHSCTVDSVGDHRIAMAAAIAAVTADGPVTILGSQCVAKSYPGFWEDYKQLGGRYEQYIR